MRMETLGQTATDSESQQIDKDVLLNKLIQEKYEPIAIVGMSLRFPGGIDNLEMLENLLASGGESISFIPTSRWNNDSYFDESGTIPGKIYTHSGGYIHNFDEFDAKFFSISPKEANHIDPQQRLILELAWEALEDANIDAESLRDGDGSVYIGISTIDYAKQTVDIQDTSLASHMGTGAANSAVAGRLSYFFGLRGPCMAIDTACSSSLVTMHLAMTALRRRETSLAFCGGVNIMHHPSSHIIFSQANMLSKDGRCKTFDESADGYGRSEGAGILVLKRLSDALKDNDNILAIVRGSSVLQDGESGGLTVPNGIAQEQVMRKALESALLNPSDISYVEAHGTGTPLGDPIEIQAIDQVFGASFNKNNPLSVGSIKTNIGHMEAAAGVGGIIKVVAQLQNKKIYPHINLKNPSKHIPWESMNIDVPREVFEWHVAKKRALVNSFGFAGTISSVVLEEAPNVYEKPLLTEYNKPNLLTISAKNLNALKVLVDKYIDSFDTLDERNFNSFCVLSNIARQHFSYRVALIASDKVSAKEYLMEVKKKLNEDGGKGLELSKYKNNKICFMFTGQGSQYKQMTECVYVRFNFFKTILDQCDMLFYKHLETSIKEIIFIDKIDNSKCIDNTVYTQAALFSIEYSMAMLWIHFGIVPTILIGHSIGEIVAATVAGLFNLEDAVKLVATRGKLMQSVNQAGGMLAISKEYDSIKEFIEPYKNLSVAAINAPQQCVISGDILEIKKLSNDLMSLNLPCRELQVSHAFHSSHMDEITQEFCRSLVDITFKEPSITFISNVTGEVAKFEDVATIEYWAKHIRSSVLFSKGIKSIENRGPHCFIEVGPDSTLTALARQTVSEYEHLWLTSLRQGDHAVIPLFNSISRLYQTGAKINWKNVNEGYIKNHIKLPKYPFERKKYWFTEPKKIEAGEPLHPLLGERHNSENSTWEFISRLSSKTTDYLADHVVLDKIVFPGAGYVEIILSLQDATLGQTDFSIYDLDIHEPIILNEESNILLVKRLKKVNNTRYDFEILSGESKENLRKNATGRFEKLCINEDLAILNNLKNESTPEKKINRIKHEQIYDVLSEKGLSYGKAFKRAEYVDVFTNLIGRGEITNYRYSALDFLNPTLFDAVLHILDPILHMVDSENTYLPVGFKKFTFIKKPRNKLECLVNLKQVDNDISPFTADLFLLDNDEIVFTLIGLKIRKVSDVTNKPIKKMLFTRNWKLSNLKRKDDISGGVLYINYDINENDEYCSEYDNLHIRYASTIEDVAALLTTDFKLTHIIYVWKCMSSENDYISMKASCEYNYKFILNLIKLLEEKQNRTEIKLNFVTKNGQFIAGDDSSKVNNNEIVQSTLWGFYNVLCNELPRYAAKIIDISASQNLLHDDYDNILQEAFVSVSDDEHEICYRNSNRYVRRIEDIAPSGVSLENFKLGVDEYGTFSNIKQISIPVVQPTGNEVLIKVHAAGLNFKDVLNALGLLAQHAQALGIEHSQMPLGFECSGVVIAAGPTADFSIGDDVVVSQLGCMQKYITVDSTTIVRKPKNISHEEAAGIATAYVTSYYALHNLAKIQQGDKILIHAAAGGVGQAAVQLALRASAEIYATASEKKWDVLKKQGIRHIMSSRDLSFGSQISSLTNGAGVDIVLNSLNKKFINVGINALSKNGRFIEIGKLDILKPEQVKDLRADIEYHNFDLSELPAEELKKINKEILEKIVALIESNEITPLPTKVYSINNIEDAFSDLSRGNNIGKLVISFADIQPVLNHEPAPISSNKCYLVTGGYGALGLIAIKWLADAGAKHIALLGRNPVTSEKLEKVRQELGHSGLSLIPLQGDVSNRQQMADIFSYLKNTSPVLGGVIHTAGVLDDMPIMSQSWSTMETVFLPKVYGTWILQEQISLLGGLDFFIGYSSIASVIGSLGQANYAAANAYVDYLMNWRSASGEHGLAINWGPWAEVGMAARLTKKQIYAVESKGVKFLNPRAAMRALSDVLTLRVPQVIIGEVNWHEYVDSLNYSNKLYAGLVNKALKKNNAINIEALKKLSFQDRLMEITMAIRNMLAAVLHFDNVDDIEFDAKFSELGLDSLVSVEFKNMIEKTFEISINTSITFDYPSIPSISKFISEYYFPSNLNEETHKNHKGLEKNGLKKIIAKLVS